jgi:hypothetical protein
MRLAGSNMLGIALSPNPLENRCQIGWMLNDGDGEQGIKDLKQSVTAAAEGDINLMTKGAQPLKGFCVHAVSMPKRAFSV